MVEEEQLDKYRKDIEPLLKKKGFNYDDLRFYDLSASFKETGGAEKIEHIKGKFITDEKKIYSFTLTFGKENLIEIKSEKSPEGVFSKLKKF